jgi:hypothetical protein
MAVTMEDVRAALDPEEPDYTNAAQLGPQALPHLEVMVSSGDTMLASKAAYLASLIKGGAKSAEIVATAAQSSDPAVRVAAAAAASNLSPSGANAVLLELVADPDPGVRKVARSSVPARPTAKLAERLEAIHAETELEEAASPAGGPGLLTGRMRGETGGEAGGDRPTMPGEHRGSSMPGEQEKMPGE